VKEDVAGGVDVVHEVAIVQDRAGVGRMVGDRKVSRTRGSSEEAIDILFNQSTSIIKHCVWFTF